MFSVSFLALIMWCSVSLWFFVFCSVSAIRDVNFGTPSPNPNCTVLPKGRVPWIIAVRDSDYGWKEHTHRANIALAVATYRGTDDEMRRMGLQLEVELIRALFRNKTSPMDDSELALFIHALIATNKNPRDFNGIDLVADLIHRVESARGTVNPFLVLALCNSHAVKFDHLLKLRDSLRLDEFVNDPDINSIETQLKAIAFKAFACSVSLSPANKKFIAEMDLIAGRLIKKYNDNEGRFGNVYTTSLAVQALVASKVVSHNRYKGWDEEKTLEFLEKESEINVNLIKAYYIEMALNAKNVNFIKDLYTKGPIVAPGNTSPQKYYVQYTVKNGMEPDVYFSITMKVPERTNFYKIMTDVSQLSDGFKFSSYENESRQPMVYAVSGIPNDAEQNMFWRICRQNGVNHTRHDSNIVTFNESPVKLFPEHDEHIILWYRDAECPKK